MPLSASAALRFEVWCRVSAGSGVIRLAVSGASVSVANGCRSFSLGVLSVLFQRSWLYRRRSASSTLKYRHFRRFLAHPVKKGTGRSAALLLALRARVTLTGDSRSTLCRGPCRAGSLTGAVRLSNGNAGVPRRAQRGRKPRVEQKGKSSLDLDFQYEYGPRKRGPSILSARRALSAERCQKSYHRDNWLVAAKRS